MVWSHHENPRLPCLGRRLMIFLLYSKNRLVLISKPKSGGPGLIISALAIVYSQLFTFYVTKTMFVIRYSFQERCCSNSHGQLTEGVGEALYV